VTQPTDVPGDPAADLPDQPVEGRADAGVPADRYGPPPSPTRRVAAIVLAVLALAGALAWAGWIGLDAARKGVAWSDVGFVVEGDSAVRVTYDVTKDPQDTAVCSLRALDANKVAVGVAQVRVGPADARTTRHTDTVRTSTLAVAATVRTCEIAR
jgi:hypothetical protein